MAFRNVIRRPARSSLIVIGLMLATTIISSAFTTGDSVTHSIKSQAISDLGFIDEIIRIDDDSESWRGSAVPSEFAQSIFERISPVLNADPHVDGLMPVLKGRVAITNYRSKQFAVNSLLVGVDPAMTRGFGELIRENGMPVNLASLEPHEVVIDKAGAREIGAEIGDELGVAVGPGELLPLKIAAISDGWYLKEDDSKLVLTTTLQFAQEIFKKEGLLSYILISNEGDELGGIEVAPEIIDAYKEHPILTDAGFELFNLKGEIIRIANAFGSLFVSLFTSFGLFSIGVGLLLIVLIFSMLAAERKAELGISRAIGMQRTHLVRLFMMEGAIYGLGSGLVGAIAGVGLGYLLIYSVAGNLGPQAEDFKLSPHVNFLSVVTSFLLGSVLTFLTVIYSSWRVSRLNIVRAIKDIAEPPEGKASKGTLIRALLIILFGWGSTGYGFHLENLTLFGVGISSTIIGLALILNWVGVAQRWVLTGAGLMLMVYWLLPSKVIDLIKEDWNTDFSIWFVSSALTVTGAVLVVMNNSNLIVKMLTSVLGRSRRIAPIMKSAVSYPMHFKFRTGLSVAMFAVVVFSVVVLLVIVGGFNALLRDQERLAGGYDVVAFSQNPLNPLDGLHQQVLGNQELDFVERIDGIPSIGTLRSRYRSQGKLPGDKEFLDTTVTGADDDFLLSNKFTIELATKDYLDEDGFDRRKVWIALKDNPGLAIVDSSMVSTRNRFDFELESDSFRLTGVQGLVLENETMEPVKVSIKDIESGAIFDLKVIAVLDSFASSGSGPGLMPSGIFTSSKVFEAHLGAKVNATQFYFNVEPATEYPAQKIEAAFFQNALETLDIANYIDELQSTNRGFNTLLVGFMLLGLVAGVVALGIISARAVVERRHQIGIMRAIGFSRGMVQISFLAESSYVAILGIGIGLIFGLLMGIIVVNDIRAEEPNLPLVIPWGSLILIGFAAYMCSLVATYLPSRQASRIMPADALRYE